MAVAAPNYQAMAAMYAQKYGVPVDIFERQIGQESGFKPNARSGAGALGIAQFMPSTAAAMGVNPMDPASALDGAARLDAQNIKKYGSVARALSAYNSGRPDAYLDPKFAGGQTYHYVQSILGGKTPSGVTSSMTPSGSTAAAPGGPSGMQNALAAMMLQQAGLTASGQQADSGSLLGMALARQQAQATQSIYGPAKTSIQAGDVTIHGVNPSNPQHAGVVQSIESYVGTPYVWGGESPKGFDCSGLLQYVWGKQGVNIPRTTYDQWKAGAPVATNQLQPGDAVFFKGSDSKGGLPGHVGMYIGDGEFVEAPHTGATVRISHLSDRSDYVGARRFA